jgi:hypothetical protein
MTREFSENSPGRGILGKIGPGGKDKFVLPTGLGAGQKCQSPLRALIFFGLDNV